MTDDTKPDEAEIAAEASRYEMRKAKEEEALDPVPTSIPEAVQQAAEAQPAPIIETPQSEGDHGRMLLEAQTVRHLCRLRVGRTAEVELLMDGEACPADEIVYISEHNWKEAGRNWGHVSAIHGPAGKPLWWTPRQDGAIRKWMRAFKWLIEQRRKEGGYNRSLLVGSKGKTRRG